MLGSESAMDGAAAERGGLMLLDDKDGSNTVDIVFAAKPRLVVERSFQVRSGARDVVENPAAYIQCCLNLQVIQPQA